MNNTHTIAFAVAGILAVATLGACATDSSSPDRLATEQSDDTPEQTEQPTDGAVTPPAAEITPDPPDEPTAAPVVMPNLVGMNLQLAQDTLQTLGSYLLDQRTPLDSIGCR